MDCHFQVCIQNLQINVWPSRILQTKPEGLPFNLKVIRSVQTFPKDVKSDQDLWFTKRQKIWGMHFDLEKKAKYYKMTSFISDSFSSINFGQIKHTQQRLGHTTFCFSKTVVCHTNMPTQTDFVMASHTATFQKILYDSSFLF